MSTNRPVLEALDLVIGYRHRNKPDQVLSIPLNLSLKPGQLVCLLGPNGSGKSTLMRTLAGLQPVISGSVLINGQVLKELKPLDLARFLSLVLTERVESAHLSAYELISLGRTPYTGWLGTLSATDKEVISQAMDATDTNVFMHRFVHHLSDGERQKVMLARALAQDTRIILLDEPTAHLDLPNRVEMMRLLQKLARKTNKAILLSTHELDLALQTADQLWLLNQNGALITGVPEDMVLNGSFESVFTKPGFHFNRNSGTFTIHKESSAPLVYLHGDPTIVFWTKRALQREGFSTGTEPSPKYALEAGEKNNIPYWTLSVGDHRISYATIADLIAALVFNRTNDPDK